MNGAESLIRTAIAAGVEVCFANPGTTEMPIVAALDSADGLRPILGLFEGVCTGAADGYGRMAEKPAMTLLHLGPGFANGIANLHNARRARSPIVNLIGDHATWHVGADAPLTSDIVSLATPVSGWVQSVRNAASLASTTAQAIAAAGRAPGQVATLIIPSDCQWDPAERHAEPIEPTAPPAVSSDAIKRAAESIRKGKKVALFLGGTALRARGLKAAARIAAKSGCHLICETFPARLERGAGMPALDRLPYFPEQAIEMLKPFDTIVIAGAKRPVAFFGYPDFPSQLIPEGVNTAILADPTDDVPAALEALASEIARAGFGRDAVEDSAARTSRRKTQRDDRGRRDCGDDARGCDRDGRGCHHRPAVPRCVGSGAAAYVSFAHGRRDRAGIAMRNRRGGRVSGSARDRLSSRRQRDVHDPGAVDAGARVAQRHDGAVQQSQLPNPAG